MSAETDSITTLSAHLDHVESLNAHAKELMPFKVDECSLSYKTRQTQRPSPTRHQQPPRTESMESPLLPESSYQHLICAGCVLEGAACDGRYAGTEGWMMVVPAEGRKEDVPWAERWVVVGRGAEVGGKRKAEEGESEIFDALSNQERPLTEAKGDVFLRPEALDRICTCESCMPLVKALPFPLVEEPEYLPAPEDPNDPSEEELTTQALERLPRGQTIEALLAFNNMKDKLKAFLEPFRDGGRVVSAGDIEEFMQGIKESRGR
ncbi:hypothetical protein QFC20_007045 [Naganishia adeliensis]|uniref:Uncharacterized protein n=1 Tax=Naganishia adeliensis TaxID=92952 RepID=A0ACC2V3J4_9TREE|nr:hypothetical protein QFC20_007045 [Naganishia adeliensis]